MGGQVNRQVSRQPPFWWKTFKKNTWGTVAQSEWKYWCEPPLSSAAVWRTNPLFFFGYIAPKEGLNSRKFFLDFNSDWLDTFQRKTEICWRLLCLHDESNCCSSFCSVTLWLEIIGKTSAQLFCTTFFAKTCQSHVKLMYNSSWAYNLYLFCSVVVWLKAWNVTVPYPVCNGQIITITKCSYFSWI